MSESAPPPDPTGYATSAQHLEAELGRLDLILHAQARASEDVAPDPALLDRLDQVGAQIGGRVAATLRTGVDLRLVTLAELFDLAPFDVDVVVFCLAPEIDVRYEQIFAHLQGERAPTAGLVLDALCPDLESRLAARGRLTGSAPLRRHRLVVPTGTGPLPGTALRLDPRIVRFLLQDDDLDDRLRATCTVVTPTAKLADLVVPAEPGARLAALAARPGERTLVHLWGDRGVGKRTAAGALVAEWGGVLLVVDGARMAAATVERFTELVELVDRETRLQGATPCWTGVDALEPAAGHLDVLLRTAGTRTGPTILLGDRRWPPVELRPGTDLVSLELPAPGHPERLRLWSAALADPALVDAATTAGLDGAGPAARFRLSGGQIRAAVTTARGLAAARSPEAPVIEQADLAAAARLQSRPIPGGAARRITPRHGWDALVLPVEQLEQLREIVARVVLRPLVHGTWSFEPVAGGGPTVLFTGLPGTGRSLAAEVLAHTLHLDLSVLDPGAATADLTKALDEAAGNAVLFVAEADALSGEHALLRRLEQHDGVVVLAARRRENLDATLLHRLDAVVEFPMPDAPHRLRIWERAWPDAVPRADDLDLDVLAREIDLPGGGIRAIAEASAFLAAADGGVVGMRHVVHATRREFEKRGDARPGY